MANTWHHDRKRYHPWDNRHAEHKVLLEFRKRWRSRGTFHYVDCGAAGPRWFRNMFMERPSRREAKRLEHAAVRGADLDSLAWPQARKPTVYYW